MDGHYHEITQFAVGDLTKEQAERIELAMSAAMLFAIMERLRGNTSFTGPTTKIEPMYAKTMRRLRALRDGTEKYESAEGEGEDPPSENPHRTGSAQKDEE